MSQSPILITGCPRSGTKMMGRVFGTLSNQFCLISEHNNKAADIPEDQSGVNDQQLWWNAFHYEQWDEQLNRPIIDQPTENDASITALRERYLEIANGRTLVIKNPSHVLYTDLVLKVFPDARIVYCLRDPWTTMHSMTKAGREGFLLRSERVMNEGRCLLHKASISWNQAVSALISSKTETWHTIRYEAILQRPRHTIEKMCKSLSLDSLEGFGKAIQIPKPSENQQYFHIKSEFRNSPNRSQIEQELRSGCETFDYPQTPEHLPGTRLDHYVENANRKWKRIFHRKPADTRAAA
ncbi:sulfotransferase family protein [Rhodopirellula sp. SWK7]|uniref:sulfotransferase family protein n=1 Tax=Rhodopirellula sp. SWK7 TaxID=595460 RepID=UPI0002BDFAB6|nr:sulfotransferase [Rhodopirellula sp. SWK7]EMI41817.1 SecC motif-containing protein [Rhodopirellula sp. SWK7]